MTHKFPTPQRLLALVLALPILIVAPRAHPSTDPAAVDVLQVHAYRGQKLRAVVSGFAVNEQGAVLTSSHALRRAERFTVTLGDGRAEVVAELVWRDESADTALLNATGLEAAPLVFAAGGLDAGRRVNTAWRSADGRLLTASGALGVAGDGAPYQHNAMVTADGYGAPLLDECGRAVGINRRNPGRRLGFSSSRAADPEGVVFATSAPRLLALLAANNVPHQAHAEPCASAEQAALSSATAAEQARAQAEAQVDEARAEATAAEQTATEARAQVTAAEQAAAQARRAAEESQQRADLSAAEKAELQAELQRAVEAKEAAQRASEAKERAAAAAQRAVEAKEQAVAAAQRAADEAMQQAAAAQTAAEEAARARQTAQDSAEKDRRTLVIVVIGGGIAGLLALLALAVFIRRGSAARRRVAAAEAKAEEAKRLAEEPDPGGRPGWSFTVVADESGDKSTGEIGAESASDSTADFYVSAAVLQAAEQGVRVGRNPNSCDYVIDAPQVSREHCRIFLSDERLMLEDLKSANGTRIGARKLDAHAPEVIQAGDRVALGNIEFKVEYVE